MSYRRQTFSWVYGLPRHGRTGRQDRLIRRPLNVLASSAGRVARGDYQVHLPEASNDEVGQLIKAFGRMRDQRRHAETELHQQAFTDTLTGLPNRAHFNDYLDKALEQPFIYGSQEVFVSPSIGIALRHRHPGGNDFPTPGQLIPPVGAVASPRWHAMTIASK